MPANPGATGNRVRRSLPPQPVAAPAGAALEQRHFDLIGLGLVLIGIYLVFVLYFGWQGGRLGSGLAEGLMYMIGLVAYAVPIVLFATGAILIFNPICRRPGR